MKDKITIKVIFPHHGNREYVAHNITDTIPFLMWFNHVDPEIRITRLFINDTEFPCEYGVHYGNGDTTREIQESIVKHVQYCIDTYKSFFEGT